MQMILQYTEKPLPLCFFFGGRQHFQVKTNIQGYKSNVRAVMTNGTRHLYVRSLCLWFILKSTIQLSALCLIQEVLWSCWSGMFNPHFGCCLIGVLKFEGLHQGLYFFRCLTRETYCLPVLVVLRFCKFPFQAERVPGLLV